MSISRALGQQNQPPNALEANGRTPWRKSKLQNVEENVHGRMLPVAASPKKGGAHARTRPPPPPSSRGDALCACGSLSTYLSIYIYLSIPLYNIKIYRYIYISLSLSLSLSFFEQVKLLEKA